MVYRYVVMYSLFSKRQRCAPGNTGMFMEETLELHSDHSSCSRKVISIPKNPHLLMERTSVLHPSHRRPMWEVMKRECT